MKIFLGILLLGFGAQAFAQEVTYVGYYKKTPGMHMVDDIKDCSVKVTQISEGVYNISAIFQRAWWPDAHYQFVVEERSGELTNYYSVAQGAAYASLTSDTFSISKIVNGIDFLSPNGISKQRKDLFVCKNLLSF